VLKIYNQVRARPIYLIERIVSSETIGADAHSESAPATSQPQADETEV